MRFTERFNKTRRAQYAVVIALMLAAIVMQAPYMTNGTINAQANLKMPNVSRLGSLLNVQWTAGTLNNGGHAVTVSAGTGATTAAMTDCSSPGYASCNFIYSNSSGTVAITTTRATAFAAGNTLMAYAETNGSAITKLSYPQQANIPYSGGIASLTNCGNSTSCATPTQIQGQAVLIAAGSATLTGGTVTITGITPAFSRNSTTNAWNFGCTASLNATTTSATAQSITVVPQSTSSITITVGASASATDIVRWQCIGY